MSTHLVIGDPHAHYLQSNHRADILSRVIADIKPDVVVNMGDQADMPSLSSYDVGKRSFHGRTYDADVTACVEFSHRVFAPLKKKKKKLPRFVILEGNHEHRIERALDLSPELEGTISFNDLGYQDYYDDIVRYNGNTPGSISIDGLTYAHFFVSGIKGYPLGGEHAADSHIAKLYTSTVSAHTHLFDYSIRTNTYGKKIMGLVAGCYLDYHADWAGEINRLWDKGICVLRNVSDGTYDLQWISLQALEKEYGNV